MISSIGSNTNASIMYSTKTKSTQSDFASIDSLKNTATVDEEDASQSTAADVDLQNLYEAEQLSTYFKISDSEQQTSSKVSNAAALTADELKSIQSELTSSDDPMKYYAAANELYVKGVISKEDLPKTIASWSSATGETEFFNGTIEELDAATQEAPDYVENLVKSNLSKLISDLESSELIEESKI